MNDVDVNRSKPIGARLALWTYAGIGLVALIPSAMIDDTPRPTLLTLIVVYAVGIVLVDAAGKRVRGTALAAASAVVLLLIIIAPLLGRYP